MSIRPVAQTNLAMPAMEGAGVHLHRAFGFGDPERMDPFLLFDDFRGDRPADYLRGFPWHPHRGIETITYVLAGSVDHGDSLGNRGTLKGGDVQWMTAGSGILHQEMPKGNAKGQMHGFQLWANLPGHLKMTAPRYQDVKSQRYPRDHGRRRHHRTVDRRQSSGARPARWTASPPTRNTSTSMCRRASARSFKVDTYRHAFAYVFDGSGNFRDASRPRGVLLEKEVRGEEVNIRDMSGNRTLIEFGTGDEVTVQAGDDGVRFLLISGAPLQEPVAWHGPIVMNTQAEIATGHGRPAQRHLHQARALTPLVVAAAIGVAGFLRPCRSVIRGHDVSA